MLIRSLFLIYVIIFSFYVYYYPIKINKYSEIKFSKLKLPKVEKIYTCEISTYHLNSKECGNTWKEFMNKHKLKNDMIFQSRFIAIDRNMGLLKGDTIEIIEPLQFSGKWVIKDLTHKKIKNRIDILISNDQKGTLIKNAKFRKHGK